MTSLLLAVPVEIALVGAAAAVALLLVFQVRLAKKTEGLGREVARLRKAQHDGALDQRTRLEEAGRSLAALEALEPQVADVSSRVDEIDERLKAVTPRLDRAAALGEQAEESLRQAEARLATAEEVTQGTSQRLAAMEEQLRDAERELQQVREGLDRVRRSGASTPPVAAAVPAASPKPEPEVDEIDLGAPHDAPPHDGLPVGTPPPPFLRREAGEFTFEGETEDGEPGGMHTVLVIVILLAAATMLVHWLGTGR